MNKLSYSAHNSDRSDITHFTQGVHKCFLWCIPWVKKRRHDTLVHIFAKYWPIFKFFHRRTQLEIFNKIINKDPTSPRMCCYTTLWNVKNRKTSNNLNQVRCLTINQQIFNELHEPYPGELMHSREILKMSSSSPNAGTQASAPLVDGIVNHVLLQSGPDLNQSLSQLVYVLHFFQVDAILHHSSNLVIYWVEIWAIRRPQIRWDECRRLPLQQLDCLACPVRQCTVLLEHFTR